jgi:hypothetical protein
MAGGPGTGFAFEAYGWSVLAGVGCMLLFVVARKGGLGLKSFVVLAAALIWAVLRGMTANVRTPLVDTATLISGDFNACATGNGADYGAQLSVPAVVDQERSGPLPAWACAGGRTRSLRLAWRLSRPLRGPTAHSTAPSVQAEKSSSSRSMGVPCSRRLSTPTPSGDAAALADWAVARLDATEEAFVAFSTCGNTALAPTGRKARPGRFRSCRVAANGRAGR